LQKVRPKFTDLIAKSGATAAPFGLLDHDFMDQPTSDVFIQPLCQLGFLHAEFFLQRRTIQPEQEPAPGLQLYERGHFLSKQRKASFPSLNHIHFVQLVLHFVQLDELINGRLQRQGMA